jgi:hypothetical protein
MTFSLPIIASTRFMFAIKGSYNITFVIFLCSWLGSKVRFASTVIKSEFAICNKSDTFHFIMPLSIVIFNISQNDSIDTKEHVKGFCSAL